MPTKSLIPVTVLTTLVALYSVITGQWMIAALFIALAIVLLTLWRCWQ